jgi:hypothetical protein
MNQEIHHKTKWHTLIHTNHRTRIPATAPGGAPSRPAADAELGNPPLDRARLRHMAVSRLRREGLTREGSRWEGADAREGRRTKATFAGGGAVGGSGAPRTAGRSGARRRQGRGCRLRVRDGRIGGVGIRVCYYIYIGLMGRPG